MVAKVARFAAPIALVAVAVGTYMIVDAGLATHSRVNSVHAPAGSSTAAAGRSRPSRGARVYVVRSGDTLSSISVRTRVGLQRLLSLNPSVSPNSLQAGQRLRLRR